MKTKKICTKCKKEKSLSDFSKNKNIKDGLAQWCKACFKAYSKKRYEDNRDRIKAQVAKWRSANREKTRGYSNLSKKRKRALENKNECE